MSEMNSVLLAEKFSGKIQTLTQEIGKVIVGQEEVVKALVNALFCHGHVLMVGVPGLAKTLLVKTLATAMDLEFNRVQFTPDLMPSDILGSEILDDSRQFRFIKGPVFANLVLADEINRTPPKTQSALLEAMQERQVTVGGKLYPLPEPFFVLATQNPIEQEGTYPLPEAQLDRFMFNVKVDYPTFEEEMAVVKSTTSDQQVKLRAIMTGDDIIAFQQLVRKVPVADNVISYAVKLVASTRINTPGSPDFVKDLLSWGAGPRASQYLILGAKAHALLKGKYTPDIEDVKAIAVPVLRHRIVPGFTAEADGITADDIIHRLMKAS